jgi:hypothetical protein
MKHGYGTGIQTANARVYNGYILIAGDKVHSATISERSDTGYFPGFVKGQ